MSAVACARKPKAGPAADGFKDLSDVAVDGATLASREQADGEPVIFVHGSASDLRMAQRPGTPSSRPV